MNLINLIKPSPILIIELENKQNTTLTHYYHSYSNNPFTNLVYISNYIF